MKCYICSKEACGKIRNIGNTDGLTLYVCKKHFTKKGREVCTKKIDEVYDL